MAGFTCVSTGISLLGDWQVKNFMLHYVGQTAICWRNIYLAPENKYIYSYVYFPMQANFLNTEYKRAFAASPGQCMKVIDRRGRGESRGRQPSQRDGPHFKHVLWEWIHKRTTNAQGLLHHCADRLPRTTVGILIFIDRRLFSRWLWRSEVQWGKRF